MNEIPDDWPNRPYSRHVTLGTITWHIQTMGNGPVLLFLHGAGASAHSWAPLIEGLTPDYTCIAIDLPGHGFTSGARSFQLGLRGITDEVEHLLVDQGIAPEMLIGHSAGAAVAVTLADRIGKPPIIAINGAFQSFEGLAGVLFPLIAKSMVAVPFVRDFFTVPLAQSANIKTLIDGTGTVLPPEKLKHYRTLLRRRSHITGTLGMMAQWNLSRDMPKAMQITAPTHFIQAADDRTVEMEDTAAFRQRVIDAKETVFKVGGHLIHEMQPDLILPIIKDAMKGVQTAQT
ncbi:MAG: alpha/beta fold hydrolase BchO [Pseudomonadota bacterium]